MKRCFPGLWLLAVGLLLLTAQAALADIVRYHYQPQDLCGHTSLRVAPDGAAGVWRSWALSPRQQPYYCQLRPTHMVTFRHPYTCQNVQVPIALPEGTPRLAYEPYAVVYQYTPYVVRVEFLPDGGVDVIYNSGFLRPLTPQ